MRQEQLSREDLREVAHVNDVGTMETLMQLLAERSAQQLVYSSLGREIQVSVDTIKRWVDLLARLHYGFMVRPWFANVAKALRKEPKWFQRDWSGLADDGARAETMVERRMYRALAVHARWRSRAHNFKTNLSRQRARNCVLGPSRAVA